MQEQSREQDVGAYILLPFEEAQQFRDTIDKLIPYEHGQIIGTINSFKGETRKKVESYTHGRG